MRTQAPIEYIDPSMTLFIAKHYQSIDKSDYTHCEIEASLGLKCSYIKHTVSNILKPKNVFSSQQTKQAVGVYSSAYNTRS